MEKIRKACQGVLNIIRFNRHFFIAALCLLMLLMAAAFFINPYRNYFILLCVLIIATTTISLAVSFYVYDISGLYNFKWLAEQDTQQKIINIHAGFDETSILLKHKFEAAELTALDFYDPLKHTEVSIKRARKAYPPYPGTITVETNNLPFADSIADKIFVIMAAHEIRDARERTVFFRELNRILKPDGQLFIVEHLRDVVNLLAYNIGFFHFYPKKVWHKVFGNANFTISNEIKLTPFISAFILNKNGNTI